jgi:predicted short-subunit dehydrogenase-like oxidoreductase (DUF2520 family)
MALGANVSLEASSAEPQGPVLLAIPDSAIETHAQKFQGRCAHMSGSLHLESVPSLHPLASFDGTPQDWAGVPLAITGDPPKAILEAFLSLGFAPFELPPGLKPLYHACAVLASGHIATLWAAADAMLKDAGIQLPGRGLRSLAAAALENAARQGKAGITGPFARRDEETIQRDCAALPQEWRAVFMEVGGKSGDGRELQG